jgi:PAS domain S-box-containing protein
MPGSSILRVLTLDRTANDVEPLIDTLRSAGYGVFPKHVLNPVDLLSELAADEWDLFLCGRDVDGLDVAKVVRQLQKTCAGIAVIVIYDDTHHDGQTCVVEALQAGASDAVSRSNRVHLQLVVNREINRLALHRAHEKAARAHVEVQERSMVLLESSRDAIAYVHQGMHVYVNTSYAKTFGYENLEELLGVPIMNMIVDGQQESFKKVLRGYSSKESEEPYFEATCVNAEGKEFRVKMELATVTYEGEDCLQVIVRPLVSGRGGKHHMDERSRLPKLSDRQHLLGALEEGSEDARKEPSQLLYVEIDHFDVLKQRIGVEGTETIIPRIGGVLEECVPSQTLLAKLTDSALAVLIDTDVESGTAVAEQIRQRVTECLSSALKPEGEPLSVTCSIGIASLHRGTGDGSVYLNNALAACGNAMELGGNRIEAWREPDLGEDGQLLNSASAVRDALENGRVALLFQPIVSLQGDSTPMYEAYPRVLDADGEPLDTGALSADAKQIDTLIKLDEWVVEAALRVLLEQQKQKAEMRFFLELSDHAFKNERLLLFLTERLRGARLSGQSLTLQVSERSALEQTKNVRAFLKGLKPLGCRSAVEHVGRTFNTLDHVKKLPVDYFKLDASLCQRMMEGEEGQKTVAAMVQFAKSMGVQTIATGVEEAACLTLLWQTGVDLAQGHCIQEPSEVLQYDFAHED